jgi:hypothetical protein
MVVGAKKFGVVLYVIVGGGGGGGGCWSAVFSPSQKKCIPLELHFVFFSETDFWIYCTAFKLYCR